MDCPKNCLMRSTREKSDFKQTNLTSGVIANFMGLKSKLRNWRSNSIMKKNKYFYFNCSFKNKHIYINNTNIATSSNFILSLKNLVNAAKTVNSSSVQGSLMSNNISNPNNTQSHQNINPNLISDPKSVILQISDRCLEENSKEKNDIKSGKKNRVGFAMAIKNEDQQT